MECSQNVQHSKLLFLTIEKQILRDISEGIYKELFLIAESQKYMPENLMVIARYADALRKISK